MEPSDAELAAACLEGRVEAFETLVARHQDAVYNLAYRMTGRSADAEDLAQEAFIRAYRALRSYRPEHAFRNWVMGICANLTKNRFRGEARRRVTEAQHAQAAALEAAPAGAGDPRREALEAALMRLPETTRVLLVLKYMEDMPVEEVARTLGIGLSAAKMRLARGREDLQAALRVGQKESPS